MSDNEENRDGQRGHHDEREEESRHYDYDQEHRNERHFDDDDVSRDVHHHHKEENNNGDEEQFSIHINGDEVGYKLNEDALKAFFEKYGEVDRVTIIRDPSTRASRRFGFINMVRHDDAVRAVTDMEVGQIDGFEIKCQRAKRKQAYEKTPGQYLGPAALSSKFIRERRDRERDRRRDRSRDRFERRDRDRSRDRFRDRSRERLPPRDFDRGFDRGFDPRDRPPMRDPRGFDPRDVRDPRDVLDPRGFDPRDFRGPPQRYDMDPRGPPPPHFMDPRGPPPGYDMHPRSRSPPPFNRGRSPPINRPNERGPPQGYDGARAPPVANYAASSYYANAGNSNGGRNGPMPSQQVPRY